MNRFKNKSLLWVNTLALFTILALHACNGCQNKTHRRFDAPPVDVNIQRFEKDLFTIDTTRTETELTSLYKKYGLFYLSFARDMMMMKESADDPLFLHPMSMLVTYPPFRALQSSIDSTLGHLESLRPPLSKAMGIYKAQFPEERIPVFVTFLSEFGYANVTYDSIIGIGLDMYMAGSHSNYYYALEFPEYMVKKLRPEYILPNTIKALAIGQYEEQTYRDKRFLAMMIYEGKIRYFAKTLLPQVADTLILGYSAEQLAWCKDNEPEMWAHVIEKELLYKNEPSQFIRYFNDGPFTSADGVPSESAPAIGGWLGLQIVTKYMNENPTVTLKQLMEETDFDKMLKESKYRPKR